MNELKNSQSWLLIGVCILINLIGREVAHALVLPFWLDAIGTLVTAIVIGPVAGSICGVITNMLMGIIGMENLAYGIVSVGIGASVGYFYPKTTSKINMFSAISTAVFAGFVAVVLSTPLNMVLYNGRTGNVWGDGLIDMLAQDISFPIFCSILGEAFVDIPDKSLSVLIAMGIIYLWNKRKDGKNKGKKPFILMVIFFALFLLRGEAVHAVDFESDYAPTRYDTESGLATIEINTIAQTPDGYVWAGTYAGLYRCDGSRFEEMVLDERISNVMQLMVDSNGNLWIGTNDAGIACYNPESREIVFYDVDSGMPSDSIRSITQDGEGNIYVGTTAQLCKINPEGNIHVFDEQELFGVRSLDCSEKNIVSGVTNAGTLFFVDGEQILGMVTLDDENVYYAAVAAGENDVFFVGTSDDYIIQISLEEGTIIKGRKYTVQDAKYFNKILRIKEGGGFFYCCETGLGFITNEGKSTSLVSDDFEDAVSDTFIDYQGNIWFSSNKQGIVRYSKNPFQDIFAKADVPGDVVNATHIKDGLLYVGMNSGLITIDLKTYYAVPIEHPELFEGVRIRDIMEDVKGNLWVSTYGKAGLIELREDGSYEIYNQTTKNTEGGRFRFCIELSDGQIAAFSTTGINYIKDEEVVLTAGEEEGFNTQILSAYEEEPGVILAGTDGDGIYIIHDGIIEKRYAQEDGLDSPVILRIVPCGDGGYLYVTSNSLYYFKNQEIRKLNNFPYKNNYDVFFTEDGKAWVSSSAGIFVVHKDELINNSEYNYTLLNKSRGLYSSLTSNAKNSFDGENLYLCCTDGVRRIPVAMDGIFEEKYDIRISKLLAEEEEVPQLENGTYVIPAKSGRIEFDVAVLNFSLSNPLLHIYLEGANDNGITCQQKNLQPLSYMNLPHGEYKLHVQVLDVSGTVVEKEEVFDVQKESQIFERFYFRAYLFIVCVLFVLFVGWLIGNVRFNINRAEMWHQEARIDPMTGFWNKTVSQEEFANICRRKNGILMMVDLDNFKLVNDLHGHDVGDKVLISFSEIVKAITREEDAVGRVGGDEFLVFIQGSCQESVVAEKVRILNEKMKAVCLELMGEKSIIPLGISIGAVFVPEEGRDFAELYKKADKALYNVKQNGKHGYAIFHTKESGFVYETEETRGSNLNDLRMILGERNVDKGAYLVNFEKLQLVYRLFIRMSKRTFVNVWLVQFEIKNKQGKPATGEIMERFLEVLSLNLRSNDVVAPNGKSKVIIIMTDTSSKSGQTPIERILNKWEETSLSDEYELKYEAEEM